MILLSFLKKETNKNEIKKKTNAHKKGRLFTLSTHNEYNCHLVTTNNDLRLIFELIS